MPLKINKHMEFAKLGEKLAEDVVHAAIHFKMYEDLFKALHEDLYVANQSRAFWQLTLAGHLWSALIGIVRMYDQRGDTLNLLQWLETIQDHPEWFGTNAFRERLKSNPRVGNLAKHKREPDPDQLVQDIEWTNAKSNDLVKRLVRQRGSRIAHTSVKEFLKSDTMPGIGDLTFTEIKKLVERAIKIVNHYSHLFKAMSYSTQIVGHDDYQFVIQSVRERLDCIER